MTSLYRHRDLGAAEALVTAAILGVALFAWGDQTGMFSRPGLASTDNWTWRLWQIGALLMGIPGVWWIWRGTRSVTWTRSLLLTVLAVIVFLNTYTEVLSSAHFGNVWKMINPLFLGCTTVAVVALWSRGGFWDGIGAAVFAALGTVVFINAYFINHGILWEALNPLRALVFLLWAFAALQVAPQPRESADE
ncbi:MAG: hypothetical protein OXG43_11030 [Chloroflexi bacterium]|nr:hypothetical protein [Chloroflexota bacterium]